MTAEDYYNKKVFKHHLRRAIKHDKQYFEDTIIQLIDDYHKSELKLLGIGDVIKSVCPNCGNSDTDRV